MIARDHARSLAPNPASKVQPMSISTRAFAIEDYDRAVALWNSVEGVELTVGDEREEVRSYLERNPGLSRVAEEEGVLLGAAMCGHDGRRGWIYHLAVSPAHRGRGVARQLLDECVRGLQQAGIRRAILLVARENVHGHEFWLRNGWEDLAVFAMVRDL
jgi:N-acetylglutamate synthase